MGPDKKTFSLISTARVIIISSLFLSLPSSARKFFVGSKKDKNLPQNPTREFS
jgi:hypothetical protein